MQTGRSGSGAPAAWNQAVELEKRLKAELRKKSFWDADVRKLRSALQQAYEATIFANFEFAQVSVASAMMRAHRTISCLLKLELG